MTNYFTRLAQRSGIRGTDPMPAAPAPPTIAPLKQNVEVMSAPTQPIGHAAVRETDASQQIAAPPSALPLQEAKRVAETEETISTGIATRLDRESQQGTQRQDPTPPNHFPVGPKSEQRTTKVQTAPEHLTVARKINTTPPQTSASAPVSAPAVEVSPLAAMPKPVSSQLLPEHMAATAKKAAPERSAGFQKTDPARVRADVTVPAIGVSQRPAIASSANHLDGSDARSSPPGNISHDEPNSAAAGGPVEIHIGTIALEVRAPQTPVPVLRPQAKPAPADSFTPYRHYLRSW